MTLPTDTRSGGFSQPYLPAPARRAADEVRAFIQPGPRLQGGSGGNRSIPNSPAGRAKMEGAESILQVGPTETSGIIGAQGECAAINHLHSLRRASA